MAKLAASSSFSSTFSSCTFLTDSSRRGRPLLRFAGVPASTAYYSSYSSYYYYSYSSSSYSYS